MSLLTTPCFLKRKTIACYQNCGLTKETLPQNSLLSLGWDASIFPSHLWNLYSLAPAHFLYCFPTIIAFHVPIPQLHSTLHRAPRSLHHTSAFGTCFPLTSISTLTCLTKLHSSLKIQLKCSLLWKDIPGQSHSTPLYYQFSYSSTFNEIKCSLHLL